jgi:predicted enzyme related to lactoylglutathione lyase
VVRAGRRRAQHRPQRARGRGGAGRRRRVITFRAEDIEAEVERLQDRGTEFTGGVSSYDWGGWRRSTDSEGNDLQLYAPPVD